MIPAPRDGDPEGEEPTDEESGFTSADCDDVEPGEPVPEGECITAQIQCGDTIVGHTEGGIDRYNTKFYEANQCVPALHDHDGGGERVYELLLPEGEANADVYLDTPCANLSLVAMKYADGCPKATSRVHVCEMAPQSGTRSEKLHLVSQRQNRWLIVVEGEDDAEGPFQLRVECAKGLY